MNKAAVAKYTFEYGSSSAMRSFNITFDELIDALAAWKADKVYESWGIL